MNIKALLKALSLRKFATTLLLLQLSFTIGLMVNTVILTNSAIEKLNNPLLFDVEQLITVDLIPTSGAYRDTDYYRSITQQDIAKISALDGVISAAHYNQLPIQRGGWNGNMQAADFPDDAILPDELQYVPQFYTSKIGLQNLGVEIIEGRALTDSDDITRDFYTSGMRDDIEQNIVITESLAKAIYKDRSAVGELTNNGRVVGVARDFVISPTRKGEAKYFAMFGNFMYSQPDYEQHYIVRVELGKQEQVKAQLRDTILSVQSERDISLVQSMSQRLTKFYSQDSGLASLFGMLSLLMILVTVVSSFAHAHFHVTQQRKLIGIRRALGARKKDIMLYVFSENWLLSLGASLLGIATMIGLNIALSLVITIDKPNVLLYVLAVLVVFIAGSLATWLPAYKTTKISPVIATKTL
ncbi:FtsX-like permease family protein [Paraglaciecola aquimarina]|uniref:FtsX-like permease family protein n=1 Tax=Paraglaciecola aquimarina TaxID=1235557 RepID=A0ABU3SU60_9ALTE|nr:FtsX-like permease family protein [Paraglaciecola aquimarina]MDU0353540.1 FtsX-like permease family protein [Paraglaciecola aquimarina]